MSCGYADGLSPYLNKGKLGLPEKFEPVEKINEKLLVLSEWIKSANHVVVHTGAGISTSAGIPDFRGPNGVWTLEAKGLKPNINISFDDAIPSVTHMALVKLVETGKVQYIVSQNIDGLHLRSGLPREKIAELHGNMFTEQCNQCGRQIVRKSATTSVGQKCLNTWCPTLRRNGRPCRGRLYDTILDWEHDLPEKDLGMADFHSCVADLSICLGTTLQIIPSGNLPLYTKKYGGRLVICNLQPTKHDKKADMIIHGSVDDVMSCLMRFLGLPIPAYDIAKDPTKLKCDSFSEWTIEEKHVKHMRTLYESKCCGSARKRFICKNVKQQSSSEDEKKLKKIKIVKNINKSSTSCHSNVEKLLKSEQSPLVDTSVEYIRSQDLCSKNMESSGRISMDNLCFITEGGVSSLPNFQNSQDHCIDNCTFKYVSSKNSEKLQNLVNRNAESSNSANYTNNVLEEPSSNSQSFQGQTSKCTTSESDYCENTKNSLNLHEFENKNVGCIDSTDNVCSLNEDNVQGNFVEQFKPENKSSVSGKILQNLDDECIEFSKSEGSVCLINEKNLSDVKMSVSCSTSGEAVVCAS